MKSITLLLALCAIPLALSCSSSSHNSEALVDSLEQRYTKSMFRFQVDGDSTGLTEAMAAIDQLISMKPDNPKYKTMKAHYLLYVKQYDACRKMLNDEQVSAALSAFPMFPDYKTYVLLKIDALEANESGDSVRYTENVNKMEHMLHDIIFSDKFNLKYYCEHMDEASQDIIWRDMYFNRWLSLLYIQGGREAVQSALRNITKEYNLDDQLDSNSSFDYDNPLEHSINP